MEHDAGQRLGMGSGPAAAGQGRDALTAASPFAAAARAAGGVGGDGLEQAAGDMGGQAAGDDSDHSSESSTIPGLQHAVAVEAAAAAALSDSAADAARGSATTDGSEATAPPASEPVPPADEAAAAAVAEVTAAAAAAGVAGPASESPSGSVAATPTAKLSLQKQLTVKYPVVITPSGEQRQRERGAWLACEGGLTAGAGWRAGMWTAPLAGPARVASGG